MTRPFVPAGTAVGGRRTQAEGVRRVWAGGGVTGGGLAFTRGSQGVRGAGTRTGGGACAGQRAQDVGSGRTCDRPRPSGLLRMGTSCRRLGRREDAPWPTIAGRGRAWARVRLGAPGLARALARALARKIAIGCPCPEQAAARPRRPPCRVHLRASAPTRAPARRLRLLRPQRFPPNRLSRPPPSSSPSSTSGRPSLPLLPPRPTLLPLSPVFPPPHPPAGTHWPSSPSPATPSHPTRPSHPPGVPHSRPRRFISPPHPLYILPCCSAFLLLSHSFLICTTTTPAFLLAPAQPSMISTFPTPILSVAADVVRDLEGEDALFSLWARASIFPPPPPPLPFSFFTLCPQFSQSAKSRSRTAAASKTSPGASGTARWRLPNAHPPPPPAPSPPPFPRSGAHHLSPPYQTTASSPSKVRSPASPPPAGNIG